MYQPDGWQRVVPRVVAALLAAAIVGYVFAPDMFAAIGAPMLIVGNVTSGSMFLHYGRRSGQPDAKAFCLLGLGALFGAAGLIAFGIASSFTTLPPFSALDAFFLIAYGFYLAGIAFMPATEQHWRSQVRIVLDGLVGAIGATVLLWTVVFEPIRDELALLPLGQRLIGASYPMLDLVVIVGVMVLFLRRSAYRFDVRLLVVSIGFALQAVADLTYLSSAAGSSFNQAEFNLLPFLGAAFALVVAAILVRSTPAPAEVVERAVPVWSFALPYATGIGVVAYHLYLSLSGLPESILLELAAVVIMLVVIARQSLAIHENRTKVEAERRSLIASVSHELRTPLTSMIGFLTVIEEAGEEIPAEERAELSQVVLEQANYMGRMVTDIVLLARDTPEKMTLVEQATPIRGLLSSILDTLGQDASRIETRIDPDLDVRIDVDRVRQLSVNLLQNGLRYGADRCEFHLRADDDAFVIEVHDNGPGVPRKYQRRIWERFERGSNQLNSTVPGTGLGLAIVDMIAKAHGGTATYRDSDLLGGACFSIRLPGRVVSDLQSDQRVSPVKLASRPASVRSL